MRKVAFICVSLAAGLGCSDVTTLKLPDPSPDQEFGFAALFEADEPVVLGDVVRRQAIFSGRYALDGAGGLDPRLYFAYGEDLLAAAEAACARIDDASARVVCRDTVAACTSQPDDCWAAALTREGCAARLELAGVPLATYRTEDGRLGATGEEAPPTITMCGPSLDAGCPNRRAGYIITEDGRFACIAEARQLGCALTLDASGCGLPSVTLTLDAEGAPVGLVAGTCEQSTPSPSSDVLEAPKDFALTCGTRQLDFRPQEDLLATEECIRRGPATFETDAPNTGRIFDGLAVALSAESPRLYLTGQGFDDCANYGCAVRGESCQEACDNGCSTVLLLEGCTRDSWDACVDVTERADCLRRCRSYCDRPRDAACYGETYGLSLTVSPPDEPEQDSLRLDLDGDSTSAPGGHPAIAALGGPWVATVTRNTIDLFEAESADRLTARGRFATGFAASGLLTHARDALVWFGTEAEQTQVRTAVLTRGASPTLTPSPAIAVPGLPNADMGALGGSQGDWLFLAQTAPRLSDTDRTEVHIVALSAGLVLPEVSAPGVITALAPLPEGAMLVGFSRSDRRPGVGVLLPGLDRVQAAHYFDLLPGLHVEAFAVDPLTCAESRPSACRVFVAFQSEHASQPALLGVLEYDAAAPEGLRMVAALRATGAQSISSLIVEEGGAQLWAVAGERNVLSPMTLVR